MVYFSLTAVQYQKDDPLGAPLAVASLVPIFLLVSYGTIIISRRDAVPTFMLIGQLLNEIANYVAKKTIKQPRPTDYLGKGYGMPSSHAQFMSYFAVFLSLHYLLRCKTNRIIERLVITASVIAAAVVVAYSRIHLRYHTEEQVVVGFAAGAVAGAIWYFICQNILHPWVETKHLMRNEWAVWLRLRDTNRVNDITQLEYDAVMNTTTKKQE